MASYKNFSQKSRGHLDSDAFRSPQDIETTSVNRDAIREFAKVRDKWREYCSYFRWMPDHFLDMINGDNPRISLYFYQRVYLRIMLRYRKVYLTATRGTSKSYLQTLAFVLLCIFYPNNRLFICAPGKEQAAKIAKEKLEEVFEHYPLLKDEVKTLTATKDYVRVVFHNGSRYDVVQMSDASRGGRKQNLRPTASDGSTKNRSNCWKPLRVNLATT